ncbi:penicillin-binding protein 2 [Gemmatimonas aurantiaca]|nr:penicillin-binding protein 2 [Gemmatimonas aurantiaca]
MTLRSTNRDLRGGIAIFIVLALTLILGVGLFRLQAIRHEELFQQSETNRIRVQPIVPRRGSLYDRYGTALVDNRASYSISVVRSEMVEGKTIPQLEKLIGFDSSLIKKRLRNNREPVYLPAVIKRDVEFEKIAILEEQYEHYPGITYNMDRVRRYTPGLASQCFTGYVGEVSSAEEYAGPMKLGARGFVGKQGIEKQFDLPLRGREGVRYLEISAKGVVLGDLQDRPADLGSAGADLVLTIDAELQRQAAISFDTFCCGAIVALDPRNGELLAMVSMPSYDANIFSSVIPIDVWQGIIGDSNKPLLNRPLDGRYPPASPFKLVTAGALLEERIVDRQSRFDPCIGGWTFGRRWFGCWKSAGHGKIGVVESIAQSCDTYFYQATLKLGIDRLADYAVRCGLGQRTGIDLPHENGGMVPNTDTLNRMYGKRRWTKGLTLNLAIGQGELLVTPLQMAQLFSGLANEGVVYQPHLLKTIQFPDGSEISPEPEVKFTLPFSSQTMEILREGMFRVVHSKDGTAKDIAVAEYLSGGKTGTAQNPHGENHSWYIGFAPFENPEIVIAVIVENGGHGSTVAAPQVGKLMRFYLKRQEERRAETLALQEKGAR